MAIRYHNAVPANCSPDFVWNAFRDVDRWPEWNSIIGRANWTKGMPWQKDSHLHIEIVRPISLKLEPVVLGVAPPNVVHWTGKQMGVKAEILFRFDAQADGKTLLQVWQEFTGAATMLVTDRMKRDIVAVFEHWLNALKTEAERLSTAAGTATA